jgi:hypothetical protein
MFGPLNGPHMSLTADEPWSGWIRDLLNRLLASDGKSQLERLPEHLKYAAATAVMANPALVEMRTVGDAITVHITKFGHDEFARVQEQAVKNRPVPMPEWEGDPYQNGKEIRHLARPDTPERSRIASRLRRRHSSSRRTSAAASDRPGAGAMLTSVRLAARMSARLLVHKPGSKDR